MKHLAAAAIALTLVQPAHAEDHNIREGWDLLGEGSRLLLEGLMDEMRPVFEEHMLPMLVELSDLIDDIQMYEMPEMLENGDIIIRRRPPEEDAQPDDPVEL